MSTHRKTASECWFRTKSIPADCRSSDRDIPYRYEKHKPTSELDGFGQLIEDEFAKNPPRSSAEAGAKIEEWTGIKRSPIQVRKFLKKEIRCLKTGSIPAKADPLAQKEFLENTMEPVIEEAKRVECELYYMDAAHFVMGSFLCYLWCKVRMFIRTPSGRKCFAGGEQVLQ